MWSKNGIPVAMSPTPLPSRVKLIWMSVSFVVRETAPVRVVLIISFPISDVPPDAQPPTKSCKGQSAHLIPTWGNPLPAPTPSAQRQPPLLARQHLALRHWRHY